MKTKNLKQILALILSVLVSVNAFPVSARGAEIRVFEYDYFFAESARLTAESWSDDFFGEAIFEPGSGYVLIDGVHTPPHDAPAELREIIMPFAALSSAAFFEEEYIIEEIFFAAQDSDIDITWDTDAGQIILTNEFQTRRLIVSHDNAIDFAALGAMDILDGWDSLTVLQFASAAEAESACEILNAMPGVNWAEPDAFIPPPVIEMGAASEIRAASGFRSWGVERIGADVYAEFTALQPRRNVRVAVLDTGVEAAHPFFGGRVTNDGFNFIDNNDNPYDIQGHGTHVAGTVADATPGLDNILIVPVKVLNNRGSGTLLGIANGIRWSASRSDIMNLSLGGSGRAESMQLAIDYAVGHGTTVVVAAGNDNRNADNFSPAFVREAITVSAFDINDRPARFTNWGPPVDVAAPGVAVDAPIPGGGFRQKSGTSMAAPHVAAIAAMYIHNNPGIVPAEVELAMRRYVDGPDFFPDWNPRYGTGISNMKLAPKGPRSAISVEPQAPDFGSVTGNYTERAPRTITITNTGETNLTLDPLPSVQNWTLAESANWNSQLAPNSGRTFTIRPNTGLAEGLHAPQIVLSAQSVGELIPATAQTVLQPRFTVIPAPGIIVGTVGSRGAAVNGVNIALINLDTGERRDVAAGLTGQYGFTNVADGTYRLVVTAPGHNAVISGSFEKSGQGLVINEDNLMPGANVRALLVRLEGLPGQNPAGTNVTLTVSNRTRTLTEPAQGANHFWHLFGNLENNERGGIGNILGTSPGFAIGQRAVTAADFTNNVALVSVRLRGQNPENNEILGAVRPSETGAGVSGANVTLVNMQTGARQSTVTDQEGFYRFSEVPNGAYRIVTTMTGRQARVSAPFVMNSAGMVVNITNFTTGSASRILMVRTVGAEGAIVPAINMRLEGAAGTTPRVLTAPDENAGEHFWLLNSGTGNNLAGGVGTLTASRPFPHETAASAALAVTAEDYGNLFAFATLGFGSISASPTAPHFGQHMEGALSPNAQTITVRNNSGAPVTFESLPQVPGWTLTQLAGWTLPTAPNATRTFTIRPNNEALGLGTHRPQIRIQTTGGAFFTLLPEINIVETIPGTISGNVQPSQIEPGLPNVNVALVNIHTGTRQNTVTNAQGFYRFENIADGTYYVVFTAANRNARISEPVIMLGDSHVVNEQFFVTGPYEWPLLVRLTGLPNQNPPGTRLFLAGTGTQPTLNLNPPPVGTEDGLWTFLARNVSGPAGGLGTLNVVSPDFRTAQRVMANADYQNRVAFVSVDVVSEHLTVNPGAPVFGNLMQGLVPPPETITVTNNRAMPITLEPLPAVPGWNLRPGADWNTPIAPGGTRTFSVQPDTGILGEGAHYPSISITGSGQTAGIVEPIVMVQPVFAGIVSGFVQAATQEPGLSNINVVKINLDSGARTQVTTNAQGFYQFVGVPNGNYILVFTGANRNARISAPFSVENNAPKINELNLNAAAPVQPRALIVRLSGLPEHVPPGMVIELGGRTLEPMEIPDSVPYSYWRLFSTTGWGEVGGQGSLTVSIPGFNTETVEIVAGNYTQNTALVTIDMLPTGMPSGMVHGTVSASQTVIENAHVSLFNLDTNAITNHTMTNADGVFQFINVPNGRYRVIFTMPGRNAQISRAFVMDNDSHMLNNSAFGTGGNPRLLMVSLDGLTEVPPGTSVQLGTNVLAPIAPGSGLFHIMRGSGTGLAGGIGPVTVNIPGHAAHSFAVTAEDFVNQIAYFNVNTTSLRIPPGVVTGTVRPSATGVPVAGANVTLVNAETFERLHTTTNSNGVYRFENVPNGRYIMIFTSEGRQALRTAETFVIDNSGHELNTNNFGNNVNTQRLLLVRLTGFPGGLPAGTTVTITDGTSTANLVRYNAVPNEFLWELTRSGANTLAGGIGTVNVTAPVFTPGSATVTAVDYVHNFALLTINMTGLNSITANPIAPDFGRVPAGDVPPPQTITITNTGEDNVLLNPLPAVDGWTLLAGTNWGITFEPGDSREFTLQPAEDFPMGSHSVRFNVSGNGGAWAAITAGMEVTGPPLVLTTSPAEGTRGQTVQVPLTIANNPGISELEFSLRYDDTRLNLLPGHDLGTILPLENTNAQPGRLDLRFQDAADTSANGTLITLEFEIPYGVPLEETVLDFAALTAQNIAGENIFARGQNGTVNIGFLPGDVNEDTLVDAVDLLMLRQHLAGHIVYNPIFGPMRSSAAADVTSDGSLDDQDDRMLTEHLARLRNLPRGNTSLTNISTGNTGAEPVRLAAGNVFGDSFVEVPINFTANPGFWSIGFEINYNPDVLEWESFVELLPEHLSILPGRSVPGARFFVFTGHNLDSDVTMHGTLMTLGFNVRVPAVSGVSAIAITEAFAVNTLYETVPVSASSGTVIIGEESLRRGDVNLDGEVNIIDLTTLRLHLAGRSTIIADNPLSYANADFDDSGQVTAEDAARLRQYLAGL